MLILSESRYWIYAFAIGTMVQCILFFLMPWMGQTSILKPDLEYVTVDFMEWRSPNAKPSKPVTEISRQTKPQPTLPKLTKPVQELAKEKNHTPIQTKPVLTENVQLPSKEVSQPEGEQVQTAIEPPPPQANEHTETIDEAIPIPVPIFKLSAMPRYVHKAIPVFPPDMLTQGKQGEVKLEILIDKNGLVRNITVSQSLNASFDQAAIAAIRQSSFIPGNIDGKPVAVLMRLPVIFELR